MHKNQDCGACWGSHVLVRSMEKPRRRPTSFVRELLRAVWPQLLSLERCLEKEQTIHGTGGVHTHICKHTRKHTQAHAHTFLPMKRFQWTCWASHAMQHASAAAFFHELMRHVTSNTTLHWVVLSIFFPHCHCLKTCSFGFVDTTNQFLKVDSSRSGSTCFGLGATDATDATDAKACSRLRSAWLESSSCKGGGSPVGETARFRRTPQVGGRRMS